MSKPARPPYIGFFNPIGIDTKNMTRKISLIGFTTVELRHVHFLAPRSQVTGYGRSIDELYIRPAISESFFDIGCYIFLLRFKRNQHLFC